jgi:hypothetical protein
MATRFRERYGAGPLHLLAVLVSFAVAAYALERALELTSNPDRIVIWLGGSIVAHDLVLLPLYAALGALLVAGPAERGFTRVTGLSKDVYLERWLLLSAALFAASAAIFLLRLPRLRRAAARRSAGSA